MSANVYEYGSGAVNSALVSTTSVVVLPENRSRRSAVICNCGDADCYLAMGPAAQAGKGILLKANGGAYEINATNLYKGAVSAITAVAATSLSLHEGS